MNIDRTSRDNYSSYFYFVVGATIILPNLFIRLQLNVTTAKIRIVKQPRQELINLNSTER